MLTLNFADWLVMALAIGPTTIAMRFSPLLERAPADLAFQLALAAWLVAAGFSALATENAVGLPLALSVATPALLCVSTRRDLDSRAPWALPVAITAIAVLAAFCLPYGIERLGLRIDLETIAIAHAAAAGLAIAHAASHPSWTSQPERRRWLAPCALMPPIVALVAGSQTGPLGGELLAWTYLPAALLLGRELGGRAASLARAADVGGPLVFVDRTGSVVDANGPAYALFGVKGIDRRALEGELIGTPALRRLLEDPEAECGEFFRGDSPARRRFYEVRVARGYSGKPGDRALSIQDVTSHRESQQKLYRQAHFDSLTGLPNRRFLHKHLKTALDAAKGSAGSLAVIYFDLDRFKAINDSFGHAAGDELLRVVAHRLRQQVRAECTGGSEDPLLARLGGDEFVVVVRLSSIEEVPLIADRLLAVLAEPTTIEGRTLWNTGSAGIALYPQHGEDAASLVRAADIALYNAKASARGSHRIFQPELTEKAQRKISIDRELRKAIGSGELELHYQPKVRLDDGSLAGAEALLRWNNAELGSVGPGEFIPVAEEFGLIDALGLWVIDSVCASLAQWRGEGRTLVPVSINVSPLQLAQGDVAQVIADALRLHDLSPSCLEIELTESSILEDGEKAAETLLELQRYGVRVSLDDFGTGYSSLSYLNSVPLDVLKLDRSFLRNLHLDPSAEGVVSAVIAMAHSLDLEVVAEGVDSEEKREILARIGCDFIQGFASGAPMSEREFVQLLGDTTRQEAGRALVVDDGGDQLSVLAMRMNRIGLAVAYAHDPDEGLRFAESEGGSIHALVLRSGVEVALLLTLIERVERASGRAPSLILIGSESPGKDLLDLRSQVRIWALREPLDDSLLRHVVRSALEEPKRRGGERLVPRAPVEMVATLGFGDRVESALMGSLSTGGVFLEMEQPPPVDSDFTITFQLEDAQVSARASVLQHVATSSDTGETGFAARFSSLDAETEETIRAFVEARALRCLA